MAEAKQQPHHPLVLNALFLATQTIKTLRIASQLQGHRENLIPEGKKLVHFIAQIRQQSRPVLQRAGIKNRHELRAAYACERYQQLTNTPAPVFTGGRQLSKAEDRETINTISRELGHSRHDVLRAYVGTSRTLSSSVKAHTSEPDHQIGKE